MEEKINRKKRGKNHEWKYVCRFSYNTNGASKLCEQG